MQHVSPVLEHLHQISLQIQLSLKYLSGGLLDENRDRGRIHVALLQHDALDSAHLDGRRFVYGARLKGKRCNAAASSAARNAASVHLQARGCRENAMRPSAARNHSKDPLGFARQQFRRPRSAAAKRLKSRPPH